MNVVKNIGCDDLKILCIIIAVLITFSLCGCTQRRVTKTAIATVAEETTIVSPKIIMLNSPTAEPEAASDGRTNKHLACVIRIKEDKAATLLVNIYDEHGRITSTTSGDISIDYEYDKDSRLISESKYFKGFYQGCSLHEYAGNSHTKTTYSADGSVVYDGETYAEFWNHSGQPSGKVIYMNEKERFTSVVKEYDRKTGWIVTDCVQNPDGVVKDLKHSYKTNDNGNLVETVTDEASGKTISETIYMGNGRSEDRILRYEEYDAEGNTIRGFANKYVELNGRYVLKLKEVMEVNSVTGKIKADVYFYSTSEFNIEDDIYKYLGMEPDEFSGLTVHMVSSGYDDIAVTYGGFGTKIKTVTSNRDDSGRVVQVRETDRIGSFVLSRTFEYDDFGNCKKMTVEDRDNLTEYIFGYVSVPNSYCELFTCVQAEEYIEK